MPKKPQSPTKNIPRQFRVAGPMLLKDTSEASLNELRHITSRYAKHIKYIALYKAADTNKIMVLARAQEKLSIPQWRSYLGLGIQEIVYNNEVFSQVVHHAKQQEGFEEHGSLSKQPQPLFKAHIVKIPVEASQEQVLHVQLTESPSPEPMAIVKEAPAKAPTKHAKALKKQAEAFKKQLDTRKKSVYPTKNPYTAARLAYLETMKAIEQAKKYELSKAHTPVAADLSLADKKPDHPPNKKKALMRARSVYIKYLEDHHQLCQSSSTTPHDDDDGMPISFFKYMVRPAT